MNTHQTEIIIKALELQRELFERQEHRFKSHPLRVNKINEINKIITELKGGK
jgi:hypothetical protein